MNHLHRHHPTPPSVDQRTTGQILRQATSIFTSHLFTVLFLSFLVLTFRSNVENGTRYLTSFIDRDPSLRSLLSRVDISGRTHVQQHGQSHSSHRRRRPFLHLSRIGTVDDDFFSGDDDYDRSFFGSNPKPQPNGTFVVLNDFKSKLGFSTHVIDNGIKFSEIVRSGVSFKPLEKSIDSQVANQEEFENSTLSEESDTIADETTVDFQFFIKGLELGRRDATTLFFIVGILSAAYGYVILGFLVTYAWVLGIVFVLVVNDLLGKYRSFSGTIWDGSNLGLKRLSGFILMKWAVRDALTQLLGIWFFGEIEDQYAFFKIFVSLKLMPFSIVSPWIRGFERESAGFLFSWFLFDSLVAFIFAVDAWVSIVDSRKSGREVLKEGCHLLSTLLNPAINIKCLEGVVCGSLMRLLLSGLFGKLFASAFQSVMEVYFMVAWLVFYLAARYKEAASTGRTFGSRELEGFLEGFR